jgi:hypothetical protein
MYPCCFACYTQKRSRVFAKRTRLSQSADFAFAASKRTAKTEEFLREEMLSGCAAFFPLRHPERSAAKRA